MELSSSVPSPSGGGGELRHELREPLHVIALDLDQLFKPIGIIGNDVDSGWKESGTPMGL